MDHYPKWWSSTVTLYNRHEGEDRRITWYPHVIPNCFYSESNDRVTLSHSFIVSRSMVCRIRMSDDFLPKPEWDALSESEKATKFTLCVGDIVVNGEVDDIVDEYTKGSRSTDLVSRYADWPGCLTIDSVSINTGEGRGNRHYSVRGK